MSNEMKRVVGMVGRGGTLSRCGDEGVTYGRRLDLTANASFVVPQGEKRKGKKRNQGAA